MRKFVMPLAMLALFSTGAVAGTRVVDGIEVRDWKAIDTNADHYISGEEMERHLKAQWEKNRQAAKAWPPLAKAG